MHSMLSIDLIDVITPKKLLTKFCKVADLLDRHTAYIGSMNKERMLTSVCWSDERNETMKGMTSLRSWSLFIVRS